MSGDSLSANRFFNAQRLLPSLTAGIVMGLLEIAMAVSLATLIFSGPLAPYRALGIGLAILGAVLSSTVVALFSSKPGMLGGNQELPGVIMALIVADIVLFMPAAGSEAILITVLAAIVITTVLTGLVFIALGYFQLGNLVRFLPYPVVGGFLAATGWLLVSGGLSIMVELPQDWRGLGLLLTPQSILRWLPGVLIAFLLLFLTERSHNYLAIPAVLIAGTFLFYLAAWISGASLAQLQQEGWLLGPFSGGGLWRPFPLEDISQIDWRVIGRQALQIGAIVLVSAVALLLNTSGVELATRKDLKLNRELTAAGVGNLLSGLVSGLVGFQQLGLTVMNDKLGANNRLPGLVGALICLLALIFGASLLSLMPQVVVVGLLMFLGLGFLTDWLVKAWFKLPKIDYLIVISIVLVTMVSGFLEGVILGLVLALILFVVGYSRIGVVRHELSGATFKSRVSRPRRQMALLRREGETLVIFKLQGFIFFGTAEQLLDRVRRRLEDGQRPRPMAVYLDFSRVTGLDSTGLLSFGRMKQLSEAVGACLVFVAPSADLRHRLEKDGLGEDGERLRIFSNLDRAVQWGEDRLLAQADEQGALPPGAIEAQMKAILGDEAATGELMPYFEKLQVQAGQRLIAMGDEACDLFFIESGQVTAQIPRQGQTAVRLETIGAGHVVGEIGLYLARERTAEVVVDQPGIVYRLSDEALERMEKSDAQAAATLHRLMAILLAERMVHLTNSFNALEQD